MQHSVQSLSRLSGVSPARLRTWERRYGVPSPSRTATGLRRYSPEDVNMVQRMAALVSAGLPASEAAAAVRGASVPERPVPLPAGDDALERRPEVAEITAAVVGFERARISGTLRAVVAAEGWAAALRGVLFPALREVGDLWHEGRLTPAHEHFLTDAFRSEMILAVAGNGPGPVGPPVVLACPQDEPHDLGLLGLRLLLAERDVPLLYLGADLPADALVRAARDTRAVAVALSAVSPAGFASLLQSLRALGEALPGMPVFTGGPAVSVPIPGASLLPPAIDEAADGIARFVLGRAKAAT